MLFQGAMHRKDFMTLQTCAGFARAVIPARLRGSCANGTEGHGMGVKRAAYDAGKTPPQASLSGAVPGLTRILSEKWQLFATRRN